MRADGRVVEADKDVLRDHQRLVQQLPLPLPPALLLHTLGLARLVDLDLHVDLQAALHEQGQQAVAQPGQVLGHAQQLAGVLHEGARPDEAAVGEGLFQRRVQLRHARGHQRQHRAQRHVNGLLPLPRAVRGAVHDCDADGDALALAC